MPELDKLAKLIAHRQEQERKNDRLRVHKNKIENDKLKVQVTHLDWNKVLRSREFANVEENYMRKLEKIYNRQMFIEQKRIEHQEKIQNEKEAKKRNLENREFSKEVTEKERRRQLHGTKQEFTKLFMAKAKSMSNGYRDNDPPKSYYKKKGIVPPDKMVTPDISAEAQERFGGGRRTPSSAEHLFKSLPKETLYGIEIPESLSRRPSSRSVSVRSQSVRSEPSEQLMPETPTFVDEDAIHNAAIDDVFRVNVRPCTAPTKRQSNQDGKGRVLVTERNADYVQLTNNQQVGVEPEIQQIEIRKPRRPATAAASVHFAGNILESGEKKRPSTSRRRASLKPPGMMMFRKRASSAGAGQNGTRLGSTADKNRNQRSNSKGTLMTNVEQDRIRQKIQEKAECLYRERVKRTVVSLMNEQKETVPQRIRSANSPRELPFYRNYLKNVDIEARTKYGDYLKNYKRSSEMETMLSYIERCEYGLAIADTGQAKTLLLQATVDKYNELKGGVRGFVNK